MYMFLYLLCSDLSNTAVRSDNTLRSSNGTSDNKMVLAAVMQQPSKAMRPQIIELDKVRIMDNCYDYHAV